MSARRGNPQGVSAEVFLKRARLQAKSSNRATEPQTITTTGFSVLPISSPESPRPFEGCKRGFLTNGTERQERCTVVADPALANAAALYLVENFVERLTKRAIHSTK